MTVVEAASYLSGPMAGMMLADLGADVTKVEPPRGDPYRRLGPPYGDSSLAFKAANQNKRSVAIDLKSEAGFDEFATLLAGADVLLTNWRPGVAEELGLSAGGLRARFPRLVWARVSGYGQDGPRARLPAFDGIIQARSGGLVAGSDEPFNTNNNVADKVSAMFAAHAITAALFRRERSGEGAVVDLAMVDAMAYFYATDLGAGHRIADRDPDLRVASNLASPSIMATADGWLTVAPVSGRQLRASMEAAGVGDRFGEVMDADRSATFGLFTEIMGPALLTRTAVEWETIFADADVPAARIRSFDEHVTDEQTVHNGTYRPVDDPSVDGRWLVVRHPALFDGDPVSTTTLPAPRHPNP